MIFQKSDSVDKEKIMQAKLLERVHLLWVSCKMEHKIM